MKHNKITAIIDGIFAALAVIGACGAVWYGVRLVMEAVG